MKLLFIGSGSAFVTREYNYQSNILFITPDNKKLLVDCGSDARHALHDLNLSYRDIDNVYISHLHADHIGGMEWLAFNRLFDVCCKKPNLYIHKSMSRLIWDCALSGGLRSLQGEKNELKTFFTLKALGNSFKWEKTSFKLIKTIHTYNDNKLNPSYGLFFEINKKKIFLSTDTTFQPQLYKKYYLSADLIFHDCELHNKTACVHTPYSELLSLEPSIRKKIWLYHYSNDSDNLPDAVKDGFRGFVRRGQLFDLLDKNNYL